MFKWIKESLFGSDRGYEEGSTVLPKVQNILPMPKVKPTKGNDISEPVISFVETVRKNPKRFDVDEDSKYYMICGTTETSEYDAYKIWDKKLDKGWYVRGSRWIATPSFLLEYSSRSLKFRAYEHAFFLTSDEKEYLTKEISSIMKYRIDRKAKLDKIRADRRIRDTRNKIKELYK